MRVLAAAGYPAIAVLAWLVHGWLGPEPFARDWGGVQRAAALLFVAAGAAAYRLPGFSFTSRALLATAGAWLAVDEWLMVHECLKFGPLARSGLLREVPILLYAGAGAAVAIAVIRKANPTTEAPAHGAIAAAAAGAVLLIDVGGVLHGPGAEVLEETVELLAAYGAIVACTAAARGRPSATWREASAVAAWSAAWLGAAAWLLKPVVCPARFL